MPLQRAAIGADVYILFLCGDFEYVGVLFVHSTWQRNMGIQRRLSRRPSLLIDASKPTRSSQTNNINNHLLYHKAARLSSRFISSGLHTLYLENADGAAMEMIVVLLLMFTRRPLCLSSVCH